MGQIFDEIRLQQQVDVARSEHEAQWHERREKYDRLHENYDDPPRSDKQWWQFWKRQDDD